ASRSRLISMDEVDDSVLGLPLRAAKKLRGCHQMHAETLSREDVFAVASALRATEPGAADLYL
ncbi:hypothetical protein Pmar_PMAR026378, partial [Perkinsus marinus ATCC 50983]